MELPFTVNGVKAYFASDANFDPSKIVEDSAYVLDADGWNIYRRNSVSESLTSVRVEAGMPRLKAMCNMRAEKIPYSLIRKVGRFFTEVYKLHKSEAQGYLYYAPKLGWEFVPPEQTATAAHCKYDLHSHLTSGKHQARKNAGYKIAGTIHSHGSMGAFHSGTDEKDEANFDGVHITIGKVDEVRHELALSVVCSGQRYKCTEEELICGFGDTAIPAEWIESVKKPEQPTPAAFQRITVTNTRAGSNPTSSFQHTQAPGYQHVYSNDEWMKLSKSQKKAIKKAQKKAEDEGDETGGGLLSFFDSRRFGGW